MLFILSREQGYDLLGPQNHVAVQCTPDLSINTYSFLITPNLLTNHSCGSDIYKDSVLALLNKRKNPGGISNLKLE